MAKAQIILGEMGGVDDSFLKEMYIATGEIKPFTNGTTSAEFKSGNGMSFTPYSVFYCRGYNTINIAGEASFYVYAYGEDVSQTPTLLVDGAIVQNITIPSGIVWLAISRRAYSAVDRVVTFS